ncbi:MAG: SDR family NAD(P)-dependent oxidoreductase [Planctomycetota bacterium]|jgi:NADP-dependent 3-hydroxy acid dehydrogenase YdfG
MDALAMQGRLAVVTGASAGIGRATAVRLAEQGMSLVIGARREERLGTLADELTSRFATRVVAHRLDVREASSVGEFAAAAHQAAGESGVDVLVNNAGLARGVTHLPAAGPGDEVDWEEVLDTNVMGLLRTTRVFVPGMVARGSGHVVNLGSLAGVETYEGGAVYCASKAAVRVLSRGLRLELLGTGVRVTCVNPGLVSETEFSQVRLGDEERATAVYAGMTPLTADDVARAIVWAVMQPAHVEPWVAACGSPRAASHCA